MAFGFIGYVFCYCCQQVIHNDITAHQQPVAQSVQDIESFLKQYSDRISPENATKLDDGRDNLKTRYDGVLTQSYNRQNQLTPALEDITKFETDVTGFEDWVQEAETTLDELVDNVGTEYEELKGQLDEHRTFVDDLNDQKGDLKYINMSGGKYLGQAKVTFLLPTGSFLYKQPNTQ